MYHFYLDESGSENAGILTYSWIAFDAQNADHVNRTWRVAAREPLSRDYGIPVDYPLHARKFIRGSGVKTLDGSRTDRAAACELMLNVLGDCPQLHIGTVYRHTHKKQKAFTSERFALYRDTLAHLDNFLATRKTKAILFVDGKGSRRHREESRALELRNLREPIFKQLGDEQLLQAVDLVAWTSYQHLLRSPGRELVSSWYDTFLRRRDINGRPLMLTPHVPAPRPATNDHSSSTWVSLSGLATA
ncbi:hypothetical protein GCM10022254_68200 [Actinomadura meridiana]|uniref:DUF3800 domain-containing protein n=1 Tax=Actinomadura meridiana TaxID=559626 RepID=A0ABP8CM83_9ACTN